MPPPEPQDDRPTGHGAQGIGLRILATTDLHMHLCAHDYYSDKPLGPTGLTYTASLIRAARAEAEARGDVVLLVDNGDVLQGTPMGDVVMADHAQDTHPAMQAFASLGYDAIGLGNHDFDFGVDALMRVAAQAPCPVISTNLAGKTGPIRSEVQLTLTAPGGGSVRLGLLSVLPPQTALWNAHHLAGRIEIDDMVEVARRASARLKADGCDLVVVLAHTGLGSATETAMAEQAAIPIAGLGSIDAVIAGHSHQLLPGPVHAGMDSVDAEAGRIHDTPVVLPGWGGSHLGQIDLRLSGGSAGWEISGAEARLISVAPDTPADPELARILAPAHAATRAALDRPVGRAERRLHSYFCLFGPDHALAVTADAQADAVRPALQAAGLDGLPLLSSVAPSKFGARAGPDAYTDVAEGEVTLRSVADLHVYRNELRVLRLSGAVLADWLEMAASLFCEVPEGSADVALFPDDVAGYNFDVIHGLSYEIDPTRPARFTAEGRLTSAGARRVGRICLGGSALDPGQEVLVVTNSYRAGGGGNFLGLRGAGQVALPPIELQEALASYFRAGPAGPGYAPPWRLAARPGTSVQVRTGPGAADLLGELPGPREDLGIGADGFLHLRLGL